MTPARRGGPSPAPTTLRNRLVLLLTGAAGYVDAVSYLALGRVFTANMTGNTVLLGLSIVQGDAAGALRAGLALGGFLAGGAAGAWIVYRHPHDHVWPRGVTVALGVECILLAAVAAGGAAPFRDHAAIVAGLVVLAALAMGIQSAAARRLDVSSVSTTFVTGTLTSLVSLIARHGVTPSASGHGKRLLAGVWAVYVAGAIAAGVMTLHAPALALLGPVVILLAVVVVAAVWF